MITPAISLTPAPLDLDLARPFGIARGIKTHAANVVVRLEGLQQIAPPLGEGAPNPRYGETQALALERLAALDLGDQRATRLLHKLGEQGAVEALLDHLAPQLVSCRSALAALDGALWDAHGKLVGAPLHQLLGAGDATELWTSFTISLEALESMVAAATAAATRFGLLKLKLGSGPRAEERRTVAAIRDAVGDETRLRVDANEGWQEAADALARIGDLADLGVELVEQPLPAGRAEDAAWLKARSPLPLFADEETAHAGAAQLSAGFHGVNVKLDKCGGLLAARRRIAAARASGLSVMIGCMVASSLALTAAAQLGGLADHLDLDGHLLLAHDPFEGLGVEEGGRVVLPSGPGLGVRPRSH